MSEHEETGVLLCAGCGKFIGKIENGKITSQHKGRVVSFTALNRPIMFDITCEKCKLKNHFEK